MRRPGWPFRFYVRARNDPRINNSSLIPLALSRAQRRRSRWTSSRVEMDADQPLCLEPG